MTEPLHIETAGKLRGTAAAWEYVLVVASMVSAAAYVVACIVDIVAVYGIRSVAAAIDAGTPPSPLTVADRLSTYNHGRTGVAATFWFMFVLFFVLYVIVQRRFMAVGRRRELNRLPAFRVWRIGIWVSLALLVITSATKSNSNTVAAIEHNATTGIAWLVVRVAVGCAYIWCAWALFTARNQLPETRGFTAPTTAAPTFPGQSLSEAVAPLPYDEYAAQREAERQAQATKPRRDDPFA